MFQNLNHISSYISSLQTKKIYVMLTEENQTNYVISLLQLKGRNPH